MATQVTASAELDQIDAQIEAAKNSLKTLEHHAIRLYAKELLKEILSGAEPELTEEQLRYHFVIAFSGPWLATWDHPLLSQLHRRVPNELRSVFVDAFNVELAKSLHLRLDKNRWIVKLT